MKLNSLKELREHVGLKPVKKKKEKPVICKKCGAEMVKKGENSWFCEKEITDKEGKVVVDNKGNPKICGNIYIRHIA